MSYSHIEIEKKWQKKWQEDKCFKAETGSKKPKYYVLDMFPYPSSHGLHVGHPEGYTATDIVSRYKRTCGFNVLHPMGWDAFGLPAEQFAIQTGVHPEETTKKSISTFKRQLQAFGFSYDWDREISTCDPKYYKWTQYIFTILHEKGLAYQKEVPVNWCPALRTVLANEEVVDGKSERGGHPVERVPMKQWMLKITSYAEELINDLDTVDWPERTKEAQKNWIGKSIGANVTFEIEGSNKALEVFTTRPDTLFGATFMVIAPEHPLIETLTSQEQSSDVKNYIDKAKRKSDVERQSEKEKTGVFSGSYAINPVNQNKIPIWIADYVLMGYGTGAIMAVPAHDERDFEFAQKYNLEIKRVIQSQEDLPFSGDGEMIDSSFLNGITNKSEAIDKVISFLEENKKGKKSIQYKLRDWLFSRQRFWGEPFPVVHFPNAELKTLPLNELPVLLPDVANYEPSEKGESPLARAKDWVNYENKENQKGLRDTDTMPGSAASSWYFLRYTDPTNESEPFSFESQKYWMPVDLYLGGPEHTVGHLLYSRFWQKVLFDAGLTSHKEPFKKLIHQGMILGHDGEKMSKSRGNVINPDDVIEKHGADALRMYLMFMGPLEKDKPWSDQGIEGIRRFLERYYRLVVEENSTKEEKKLTSSEETTKKLHQTIKKVTEDIENLSFNTAISQMMIYVNHLYKTNERPKEHLKTLTQLMMPFAPHLSEEVWNQLGESELVSTAPWPSYNPELVKEDSITMGVQVNGKMRGTIEISMETKEDAAVQKAKEIQAVTAAIGDGSLFKIIYKPGKILNLIVK